MNRPVIFFITGEPGEGKSTFAGLLAEILQKKQLRVKGVIAEGYWEGSLRSGFDLSDPDTGIRIPLADRITSQPGQDATGPGNTGTGPDPLITRNEGISEVPVPDGYHSPEISGNKESGGRFVFHQAAVRKGTSIIRHAITGRFDVILIDEIGARELNGEIWAEPLEMVLRAHRGVLLLTVRKKFLDSVMEHWDIKPAGIFDISQVKAEEAAEKILDCITPGSPDAEK